jgi:uncharacterized protein
MIGWCLAAAVVAAAVAIRVWQRLRKPHALARAGAERRLAALLDRHSVFLELRDKLGETPLFHAAKYGELNTLSMLLKRGANPNARCEGGGTALAMAAHFGYSAVVRALVASGANIDAADDLGVTALHFAAASGDVPTVRALLELGANTQLRDRTGRAPRQVAQQQAYAEVAALIDEFNPSDS